MTCEQFMNAVALSGTFTKTRAERAVIVAHGVSCPRCWEALNRLADLAESMTGELTEEEQEKIDSIAISDAMDDEFVEVVRDTAFAQWDDTGGEG